MNDNEIKKALECCISLSCEGCPLKDEHGCLTISDENALTLINRQQAEIERLQGAVQEWVDGKCLSQKHLLMIGNLQNEIEQAKSEAIKEFAERFIDEECAYCSSGSDEMIFFKKRFDNFLAKKVGGENA